jgi:hypothetical protein
MEVLFLLFCTGDIRRSLYVFSRLAGGARIASYIKLLPVFRKSIPKHSGFVADRGCAWGSGAGGDMQAYPCEGDYPDSKHEGLPKGYIRFPWSGSMCLLDYTPR